MSVFVPVWSPRPDWTSLPALVAEWVEAEVGGRITQWRTAEGGFSAGFATAVRTADGTAAFVKAVHPDLNPFVPERHRHEARVNALLPPEVPSPRLRASYDDGGWVALVFDLVDGRPARWPWRVAELTAAFEAIELMRDRLTPSAVTDEIRPAGELLANDRAACRRLLEQRPDDLDAWTSAHLARLTELADSLDCSGTTLLNLDVRADNVVIDVAGHAWIVDWSWGCVGAPFLEAVPLLLNAALAGHDPQAWAARSTAASAPPEQVDAMLALLVGMWAEAVLGPEPVGVRGLRAFQQAHLAVTQSWLERRWSA